eukprot:1143367-Pelagomonas_calceolata.AAC.1
MPRMCMHEGGATWVPFIRPGCCKTCTSCYRLKQLPAAMPLRSHSLTLFLLLPKDPVLRKRGQASKSAPARMGGNAYPTSSIKQQQ